MFALAGLGSCDSFQDKPDPVAKGMSRTVIADVVAINQPLVYNRFGSINPWGMIYALRRDVDGNAPGEASLKDDKRPRPLVLRVAAGDTLEIRFENLLMPMPADVPPAGAEAPHGEGAEAESDEKITIPDPPNDPRTRQAGIAVVGLTPVDGADPMATGLVGVAPGESQVYRYRTGTPGAYFFSSLAAVAGGEGDGGSLTHGLFGMVIVEPAGSRFYRSQVTEAALNCARGQSGIADCIANLPADSWIDYEATSADGTPLLNMLKDRGGGTHEIVHGDLTAIVVSETAAGNVGQPASPEHRSGREAWREFAVMFHDELKTIHAKDFAILNEPTSADPVDEARHKQLAGVRDGFGINYGASGMGPVLLANRLGKGPAKDCVDCAYEEFFLQSWANGDPALLAEYADDPSNVYHSYLGDRVKFYNVHAGPKETHVFHLHAHQWLSQIAGTDGNYLDSQTIAPFQTFAYEVYYGGTGNRNLTPGDSIFHCHLYPHFAQGMWSLWRVHDVLEDGSRRLPDGGGLNGEFAGKGTDPQTGTTVGGTPIPAVVPLPGQALPPSPTYVADKGSDAMPGYPFYIPGEAGFRAPQPPLEIAEDAGLPRHVTLAGERRLKPIEQALDEADMTFEIDRVDLRILPLEGTPLEKAAMRFHSTPGGKLPGRMVDALSEEAAFLVNGLPPAPGAPFANPCPQDATTAAHWVPGQESLATGTRRYDVSAIDLELVVNQYGWHDKQARINVLDRDVSDFEHRRRAADPFFFRAYSGECVEFYHTNRTLGHTAKDDFQVATPTDIIGQHIHLVKFDVTSSDGSANGFNYEDGTLARDHIGQLIEASQGRVDWSQAGEAPRSLGLKTKNGQPVFQTTVQRWWADPLLDVEGKDRTIATVFTHDHFAPSTIQQHGFYSALLVEPPGSTWKKPDGTPLADSQGQAVGTQAIIETPLDSKVTNNLKGVRREFAMAVADFALLYDQNNRPVAPPDRPEAISVDHHDPYLFNYKHEPIPLRVAEPAQQSGWRQKTGQQGDMAFVFDSETHRRPVNSTIDLRRNHSPGDPSTEIFEAYEGDMVQVRLVQGAQEVQHVFTVHGQRWRRQSADDTSPWVGSQEVGISEHFEMEMERLPFIDNVALEEARSDYLYHAGTVDSLWNGAWGLIRTYADPSRTRDIAVQTEGQPIRCRLAVLGEAGSTATNAVDPACGGNAPATSHEQAATKSLLPEQRPEGLANDYLGPDEGPARVFCVRAESEPLIYNSASGITDPSAIRYRLTKGWSFDKKKTQSFPSCGTMVEPTGFANLQPVPVPTDRTKPLVLRVRSGEIVHVQLENRIAEQAQTTGNAVLPRIVSFDADQLTPSDRVSIHPQLVSYSVRTGDGTRVGRNTAANAGNPSIAARNFRATSTWYAGHVDVSPSGPGQPYKFEAKPFLNDLGVVSALSSMADPIRHPAAGLIGAMVIEPVGATIDQVSADGTSAYVCPPSGECFREFVLMYQDGLNLKQGGGSVPDCHICDDTYDSGDFAFNYRTEPLWARLGLPRQQPDVNPETGRAQLINLNEHEIPACTFLPAFKPVETPVFRANSGERVVVRAVHPGGRARMHTFVTYGNRYLDSEIESFGSPNSSLLGPQKAVSADLGRIADGLWLYRDGPSYFVSGGLWGYIDARSNPVDRCPIP